MSHLLPTHQEEQKDYWFVTFAMAMMIPYWGLTVVTWGTDSTGRALAIILAWLLGFVWLLLGLLSGSDRDKRFMIFVSGALLGTTLIPALLGLYVNHLFRKISSPAPRPVTADYLADFPGLSGTYVGTFEHENFITNPRGATLVLGPPGSGKTSCVIEPTVALATGPVISTSVKWEVLYDTAHIRSRRGRIWALDLGSGIPDGALRVKWSPTTGVTGWDSARVIANEWASPYLVGASDRHWIDSATDWLTVLLFAGQYVSLPKFASWCRESESALGDVEDTILEHMTSPDDIEAGLAISTLKGIKAAPDKERGSIASTLRRLTAVYNSAAVLSGNGEDFDPARFIHTSDTLYIAASTEEQNASSGLIVALISAITREQKRAFNEHRQSEWLNVVVDEAANVARPPLDNWVSQFGGQCISLTVGLQDLSQARTAWPGINFLGMFPSTILLPGIRDDQTLQTFSSIAGEFDRQMISNSQGETQSWGAGGYQSSSTRSIHTERTRVVPVEAIAQMPRGEGMLWQGSDWRYVVTRPWGSEFFSGYVQKVPQQWREAQPNRSIMSKAIDDQGEELLRKAAEIRARSEANDPMEYR